MAEYPGNIMPSPGYSRTGTYQDDELLYSTHRFTQKGITLKAGQGVLKLGTVMGQKAGDKKWYAYNDAGTSGSTNEVQSITEGGSGLTSFTLTYSGQTTSSLTASTTSAAIQAALIALSNIGPADVVVTGPAGSSTGPWNVEFTGTLADTNVAEMTATPTGGTGTVTIATATAGNTADGTDVARGFLRQTVDTGALSTGSDFQGNLVISGILKLSKITAAATPNLDANAIADLNGRSDTVMDTFTF